MNNKEEHASEITCVMIVQDRASLITNWPCATGTRNHLVASLMPLLMLLMVHKGRCAYSQKLQIYELQVH